MNNDATMHLRLEGFGFEVWGASTPSGFNNLCISSEVPHLLFSPAILHHPSTLHLTDNLGSHHLP